MSHVGLRVEVHISHLYGIPYLVLMNKPALGKTDIINKNANIRRQLPIQNRRKFFHRFKGGKVIEVVDDHYSLHFVLFPDFFGYLIQLFLVARH